MPNIFLSSYSIQIKDKDSDVYLQFNRINGLKGIYQTFTDFFNLLASDAQYDETDKKIMLLKDYKNTKRENGDNDEDKNTILRGIITTGDYGYESDLLNIQTGELKYSRTIDDAELLPFYFLMVIPQNFNMGILLLERFGQFGMKKIFTENMKVYFEQQLPAYILEIEKIIPGDLVEHYLTQGRIISAKFINNTIPDDISDVIQYGSKKDKGSFECTVKASPKGHLPIGGHISKWFRINKKDRPPISSLYHIESFEYDNIKLEIDVDNQVRTLNLSHPEFLNPYYDITSQIIIKNGHPVFESINAFAMDMSKSLLNDIRKIQNNPNDGNE